MYTAEQISQATAARTREEYEAIDALNQTGAKLLLKAPAKYAHDKANPRKDSKALREGIMTHVAVLEPERFALFKPEPDCDKRTKEGKEVHAYWKSTLQPTDIPWISSLNSALSLPHSCGLRSVLDLFGNNLAMVSNQIFSMAAPSLPGFESFNCAHASSIVDGAATIGGGLVGRDTPCAPVGTDGTFDFAGEADWPIAASDWNLLPYFASTD